MTCSELKRLLPVLLDGTLSSEKQHEVNKALENCPECRQELELARQIRGFVVQMQARQPQLKMPPGFEGQLLQNIKQQHTSLEMFDASSKKFGSWLGEVMQSTGGWFASKPTARRAESRN